MAISIFYRFNGLDKRHYLSNCFSIDACILTNIERMDLNLVSVQPEPKHLTAENDVTCLYLATAASGVN